MERTRSWRDRWPGAIVAVLSAPVWMLLVGVFGFLGMLASLLPFMLVAYFDSAGTRIPNVGGISMVSIFMSAGLLIGATVIGWVYGRVFPRWWFFAPLGAMISLISRLAAPAVRDETRSLGPWPAVALIAAAALLTVMAWGAATRRPKRATIPHEESGEAECRDVEANVPDESDLTSPESAALPRSEP